MILDFILISSFFSSVARGYNKGFSQMFISLFAFVISIILAISLNNWVGELALNSDYGKKMQFSISDSINKNFESQKDTIIENSPYISSLFKLASDDEDIIDFSLISDAIAQKTVKSVISAVMIILTTLCFKFIVKLIKKICKSASSLPVIGGIDRLLGGICGIVFGVITLGLIFVLTMFIQFVPELEFVHDQYNNSIIVMLINDFIF